MLVIDISNLGAPSEVAVIDSPGDPPDLEVVGNIVYLVNGSEFRAIDASIPEAPVSLDSITTLGPASGVSVAGKLAFLSIFERGLTVVDISDPTALFELGAYRKPAELSNAFFGDALNVDAIDGLAYTADGISGMRVIDFGDEYRPALPIEIDIRPGSGVNAVNPRSRGVIPVAIFGSARIDVADIDSATLSLGRAAAGAGVDAIANHPDLNRDGFPDLLVHFSTAASGIDYADEEVCVRGATFAGVRFGGCAAVRVVREAGSSGR